MSKQSEQQAVLELLKDPMWRFKNLYHIKSEDTGEVIQFRPYPEQLDVFSAVHVENHQRIIIPKARRRGMSTGIEVMMTDQALTGPGFEGGIVDRNQAEAAKKLRNIVKISVDKMPEFMRETIKFEKDNDDQLTFTVADDTASSIYAGTSYRGGNCNFLHVSEWGWIQAEDPKRSEEIQTGAIQAARKGTILVETTWKGGKRGHLWEYTKSALETAEDEKHSRSWRVMFFPWHTDPVYSINSNSKIRSEVMDYFEKLKHESGIVCTEAQMRWYQEEAWPLNNNRFGEYPSTLEECFKSPMDGVIYEMEMARALAERRIGHVPVEQGLPVFVSFDIGRNDAMPLTFIQPVGKELRVVGYYVNHRELTGHYADYIKTWAAKRGVQDIRIILPHDGNRADNSTGQTMGDKFHELGFPQVQVVPKIPHVWTGINYVRETFPYLWFDKTAIEKNHTRGKKEFPSLRESLDNYHEAEQRVGMSVSTQPVHDDYSHGCFTGDTLVDLAGGEQLPIKDVTVGMMVETPVGPARVTAAGMTNSSASVLDLCFSDGGNVTCTPDHPFLTDKGLTRADELSSFSGVWTRDHHKRFASKESPTNYRDATMSLPRVPEGNTLTFIEQCGRTITERYRKGIMFTTRIMTLSIMTLRTLKRYLLPNTFQCMPVTASGSILVEQKRPFSPKQFLQARSGIGQKKVELGIPNMGRKLGQGGNHSLDSAVTVNARKSSLRKHITNNTVHGFVRAGQQKGFHSNLSSRFVHNATRSLRTILKAKSNGSAPHLVSGSFRERQEAVYNITVEGHHCFYANGYLVSNCDSLRNFCEAWQQGMISRMASRTTPDVNFAADETMGRTNKLAGANKWRGGSRR